jgi:hypothetical protein
MAELISVCIFCVLGGIIIATTMSLMIVTITLLVTKKKLPDKFVLVGGQGPDCYA